MKTLTEQDWVDLASFDREDSARALQVALDNIGIESRLRDERKWQRFWFLTRPEAGVHLDVLKVNYTLACDFLEQNAHLKALARRAIHCPQCHSPRVQYPQYSRKFILPTLVAHIARLFGVISKECYCEDCQHTWERHPAPRPARTSDILPEKV